LFKIHTFFLRNANAIHLLSLYKLDAYIEIDGSMYL